MAVNEPMPPIDESKPLPKLLLMGKFHAVKKDGNVSGVVKLYHMQDGGYLLRMDNFKIESAVPTLDVAILPAHTLEDVNELRGVWTVGPLKGPSGRMGYPVAEEWVASIDTVVLVKNGQHKAFAVAPLDRR